MRGPTVFAALAGLGLVLTAGCGYSVPKEEQWAKVAPGMTKQQVIDILGQPYMAQGSVLPQTKVDMYLFSDTTRYKPGERYAYYAIRFQNGQVVEKHRYLTKLPPQQVLAAVNQVRMEERDKALSQLRTGQAAPGQPAGRGRAEPRAGAEQPAGVPKTQPPPEQPGAQGRAQDLHRDQLERAQEQLDREEQQLDREQRQVQEEKQQLEQAPPGAGPELAPQSAPEQGGAGVAPGNQ
jgi:outer membrane protein assembly factor BamE (lipoprotein component of BamABCDE complex)